REGLREVDDHVPRRTSADEPAGLSVVVRLIRIPAQALPHLAAELLVLRDEELLERGAERIVPCADVHGLPFSEGGDRRLRKDSSLQVVGRIDAPEVAVVLDSRDLRSARR